jgi:plastocyanin
MAVNATFRFVPDAVGTWDYFCVIHGVAAMSGTLTAQ